MAIKQLETLRIDGRYYSNQARLADHAAFEKTPVPPNSIDFWGYQRKQFRVVIDDEGHAFVLRNFAGNFDAEEVAQEYNGYTDVVLGNAQAD